MARGYMEKFLWVDLSSGKLWEEKPDESLLRDYLGGYGIGSKVLYDRMKPGTDPLGPDNILGFITGPLTGTPALIGSRYTLVGKSPLTGGWGDANSGGHFGPAMKFAGYDAVFVVGASRTPVNLILDNGKAELRDASKYWGSETTDFEDAVKDEFGAKCEVVVIGPAGESMSLISCPISNKGRTPGRSGLGAVMGSKRLKAIAAKGDLPVSVADPGGLTKLRREYLNSLEGFFADLYRNTGTPGLLDGSIECGDAPFKNWTSGAADEGFDWKSISADAVMASQKKRWGCWHCPLACGGEMNPQPGQRHMSHKPEYETLCAFGTTTLNNDLDSIVRCNDICNAYGLDTMSTGGTVAFAIECYENGLITKNDTDGLDLRWGNSGAIVALTEKMARREGAGAIFADGVRAAAERIGKGSEQFAMHVAGQELPFHDPKFYPGMATIYHIDDTPGRHMHGLGWGITMQADWLETQNIKPGDQYQYGANGESYKGLTTMSNIVNSLGLCMMGWFSNDPDYVRKFTNAVLGTSYSFADLHWIGERIANMRHAFNLREGINPREWKIPGRAIGQPPVGKGPLGARTVDTEANEVAYLKAFDWDPRTTVPSAAKLESLGLGDVARDLGLKS